ncbi:hypothetical protein Golomagni_00746 [Golovinomyces magnicellulatus]|nr:hypothetical protein Golomagni_00746 [Golovinomyces magnicellulatus]
MAVGQNKSKALSKPNSSSKTKISKDKTLMHRRSRTGCYTCRLRRKKCDEGSPSCSACENLGLNCGYRRPSWWSNNDERRVHKEEIKMKIKNKKNSERGSSDCSKAETPRDLPQSLSGPMDFPGLDYRGRSTSIDSQPSISDLNTPPSNNDCFYVYNAPMYSDKAEYDTILPGFFPFDEEIKTEYGCYVPSFPSYAESAISDFTSFQPDSGSEAMFPFQAEVDWDYSDVSENQKLFKEERSSESVFGSSRSTDQNPAHVVDLTVGDQRLRDHFVSDVLPIIFPILEIDPHQSAHRDHVISALQTNKCYVHCCLSIAAQHQKATMQNPDEQIDNDIIRHRYATISGLCEALDHNTDHASILEATLGMVVFQGCVGHVNDSLPDIHWDQHFQAAISLVLKLDLPLLVAESSINQSTIPFNMTMTSWIDILGATMLGRAPAFAHTYREKHLSTGNASLGLRSLMGCDDHVLYLISEIACLEALKQDGMPHFQLCEHVSSLGEQISMTEIGDDVPTIPFDAHGVIDPQQLSCNITAAFCIAARIYLCSLVPGFKPSQDSCIRLVTQLTQVLAYIPSGSMGFDRSLVWVYLMAGSVTTIDSPFRSVFTKRLEALGDLASFGSLGRVSCLLKEVWKRIDDSTNHKTCDAEFISWRDVMHTKGWNFLLI